MRFYKYWLILGGVAFLIGCDDPTPPPTPPPTVPKDADAAPLQGDAPKNTGQDAEGPVAVAITLARDNQAIDLREEGFAVRWISDRERASRRGVPVGIVLDRQGAEASSVVQREPGSFQIGRVASQEEMERGWDEPGSMFRSWTFRPEWKAHADNARFRFNLVSDGVPVKIKTTDGIAIPGARVVLMQDGSSGLPPGIETASFTAMLVAGEEGAAHFHDVPEGRYTLRVSGELDEEFHCMRAGSIRFLPPSDGSVELSTEGVVRFDAPRIQELNRKLRIRITEAGRPLAGQEIRVELDWYRLPGDEGSRAAYEVECKTGDDGTAEAMLVDGWARMELTHGRIGPIEAYASVAGSSELVEMVCRIPGEEDRATLSGSVPGFASFPRDVDGRAIQWIVFIGSHEGGDPDAGMGIPFHSNISVPLDAEGRFASHEVLPGKYDVMLRGSLLGEATAETVEVMARLMQSHGRTVLVEIGKTESKKVLLKESP